MEILTAKYDIIFKRLFTEKETSDCLKSFLSAMTGIAEEDINDIEIMHNEIVPDDFNGKVSRLDLMIRVNCKQVNVEIQLVKHPGYAERALFYSARMVGGSLASGQAYIELPETISLNIVDFDIFPCEEYHSKYLLREEKRGDVLTDRLAICFFELTKLQKKEINLEDKQERWLRLLNAETKEALDMLERANDTSLNKAINVVRYMSADDALREQIRIKQKAEMDEKAMIRGAKLEGIAEERKALIESMRAEGMSEEQINRILNRR